MYKDKRKGHFAKPGSAPKKGVPNIRLNKYRKDPNAELKGNPSFVEKLMRANIMPAVCMETRNFRKKNPVSSYVDLYKHLSTIFPDWFPADKKLYNGQNFSKQLNQSKEWQAAYWSAQFDIDDMLATKIQAGLYNDTFDNKDLVKLYDIQRRSEENKQIMDTIEKNINVNMTVSEADGEC
jgi:hypothetical protein